MDNTNNTVRPAQVQRMIERRVPASSDAVKAIMTQEFDNWLKPNWSRELQCAVFMCQLSESKGPYPQFRNLYQLSSWKMRDRKAYVNAYLSKRKDTNEIDRRLAIAMGRDWHSCTQKSAI